MTGRSRKVEENLSSPLSQHLAERIKHDGKMTFHDWMEAALYHPQLGYYNRSDLKRWGRDGDYRTSPERSELFSATFSRFFANLYERLGQPNQFVIAEFGAGNGDFAADLLSSLAEEFSSIYQKTSYWIIDRSLDSVSRCRERVDQHSQHIRFSTIEEFADTSPAVIFSNELLDAFPVHRLKRVGGVLREFCVDYVDGEFALVLDATSSSLLVKYCEENVPRLSDGQTIEINPGIGQWLSLIDKSLTKGFVITVDYGDDASRLYDPELRPNGTLRAFRQHEFVDNFLESPGECDITSSVDWTYVTTEGGRLGFEVETFDRLDHFLLNAGLLVELETRLSSLTSDAERSRLTTSAREMILPGGMASSFQVLVQKRGLDEQ